MQEKSRNGPKRTHPGNHFFPVNSICTCSILYRYKTLAQHTLDWVEEFLMQYPGTNRFISSTYLDTHIDGH
ncbi:7072_t:CDS:2, partial [Cetraspora pellucida]